MKIFVSWSGERSKRVAELLSKWIPNVLQHTEVWFSSEMERGSIWFSEICTELANTSVGIVCLTRENLNSPWILFETGALAKGVPTNRVSPLLIDLSTSDLSTPLSLFNATSPNKESMLSLIKTINSSYEDSKLDDERLTASFDAFWSVFESKYNSILKETENETQTIETKTADELMTEILDSVQRIEHNMINNRAVYSFTPYGIEGVVPTADPKHVAMGRAYINTLLAPDFKQGVSKVSNPDTKDTPTSSRAKFGSEPT